MVTIGGYTLEEYPTTFVEYQIIKIENGIAYLKLSNLSSDKVKLNQIFLGSAEKISNTDFKSQGSQKLSINFTSQGQISSKPQPEQNYGMAKTDFFKVV
jgi:hypothetical protein